MIAPATRFLLCLLLTFQLALQPVFAAANSGEHRRLETFYTNTPVNVGGALDAKTGQDLVLEGAVVEAASADLTIGGDLRVASSIDTVDGSNSSRGFNASISYNFANGSIGGGVGVNGAEGSESKGWVSGNTASGIITDEALNIDVAGGTEIIGAVIASRSGDLTLATETLTVTDLGLHDDNRQLSGSLGLNVGINDEGVAKPGAVVEGQYANREVEGVARGTIGEGDVTVRSQTEEETQTQLANVNRDVDKAVEVTGITDEGFELYVSDTAIAEVAAGLPVIRKLITQLDQFLEKLLDDGRLEKPLTKKEREAAKAILESLAGGGCGASDHGALEPSFFDYIIPKAHAGTVSIPGDSACLARAAAVAGLEWLGLSDGEKKHVGFILGSMIKEGGKEADALINSIGHSISGYPGSKTAGRAVGALETIISSVADVAVLGTTLVDIYCDKDARNEFVAGIKGASVAAFEFYNETTQSEKTAYLKELGGNVGKKISDLYNDYEKALIKGDTFTAGRIEGQIAVQFVGGAIALKAAAKGAASLIKNLKNIGTNLREYVKIVKARRAPNRTVKVDVDAAKIKNSPDWKHLNEYKPNTKYELSNGDSFTTNANGQVTKQTYYPTSEAGKRTSTQTKVGKEGETGDVGGHGQPCSQGGTCDKYNLFPENGKLNNSSHKAAEARIRREFEAGNLDGPVTIRYGNVDPKTGRPERFEISYKTKNATEPTTVPFENVNPNGVN